MFLVQLIVFQILIFGALIFFLRTILTRNISSATTHLDALNSEFLRREEELKARETALETKTAASLDQTKAEIDRMRLEASRQSEEEKDKILAAARLQSEQVLQKTEQTRDLIVKELRLEIETKMAEKIRRMLLDIFPEGAREALHKIWIKDLCDGDLGDLTKMRVPDEIHEALLVTAYPLTAAERGVVKEKLETGLARRLEVKEEVDPFLVGGLKVRLGDLELDGTIAYKIRQVVHESSER
jgi:F0F1-type ATP synthase membrane subunit b/b'